MKTKRWRRLRAGETLRDGDQWWCPMLRRWEDIREFYRGRVLMAHAGAQPHAPHRRLE